MVTVQQAVQNLERKRGQIEEREFEISEAERRALKIRGPAGTITKQFELESRFGRGRAGAGLKKVRGEARERRKLILGKVREARKQLVPVKKKVKARQTEISSFQARQREIAQFNADLKFAKKLAGRNQFPIGESKRIKKLFQQIQAGKRVRKERVETLGAIGTGIIPGTFIFPEPISVTGIQPTFIGRPVASAVGGGVLVERIDTSSISGGKIDVPSTTGLTSFGLPSFKISEIETVADFRAGQRQTFFEEESLRRLQSFEPDKEFERGAREFGIQKFGELSKKEQARLGAGSLAVGVAKLGTGLVQFATPGFGGVIKEESFKSFKEKPVSTFLFGPEVEAFKPIRDKPGDIIQTGIQIAPLAIAAPFAVKTLLREGPRGVGTIVKGFSPIKTPSFEEFSLGALQAQPTRTFGVEIGKEPVTGGKQFDFVSGREFTPLFGRGGATQIQTFEALQIARGPSKPPRTIIKGGKSITEFVDPITGKGTGAVEFFTGSVDISRVGLPVKQRGLEVKGLEGFLGRGRIFKPGAREFEEFPVSGVGKLFGRKFVGVDIEPTGFGVRRPKVSEIKFEAVTKTKGFKDIISGARLTKTDLIRTDIEPTGFFRGKPIGKTDILFKKGDLGIPSETQSFQTIISRGKPSGRKSQADLFQTTKIKADIMGLGKFTQRVSTGFTIPKSPSVKALLPGPDAFGVLRQQPSSFAGTGLFERTDFVSGPIAKPSGQILIGTGLKDQFKFDTLVGVGIKSGIAQRTQPKFAGAQAFGQPLGLTEIQIQPPILDQPEIQIPGLTPPTTTTTTKTPPPSRFAPRPPKPGRPFFPIGFPTVLGGTGVRKVRRRGRRTRKTQILPSFTAIVADLRGPLPEEISIGGVDLGITPGRIRRIPRRKIKKGIRKIRRIVSKKKVKKKR